jgi:hypothetical protein
MVQPLQGWYAWNSAFPDSFTKQERSPGENNSALFGFRMIKAIDACFSTAC